MRSMKNRTVYAVTASVWVAAFGAMAGLIYELNRPLHSVATVGSAAGSFMSALLACTALALISGVWLWKVEVDHAHQLVLSPATPARRRGR